MENPNASFLLAAIVESADDAIVAKDLNGVVLSWNRGAERLFGYSAAEIVGHSITIIIPTERLGEESVVLDSIRHGRRIEHFETVRQRKDGTLIPVSLTVSPIRTEEGEIIGASKIARDISDQKRATERLEEQTRISAQLYQEAERANRAKDEFLATLSHELRTPLNVIMGWSRILRTSTSDESLRQRAVDTIERNTRAQAQLIEDLLDISRIVAGKLTIEREQVDVGAVIGSAIEDIQPLAQARQITLTWTLGDDAFTVWGDAARLQQIVRNLLSNAVKFTPPGGQVTVSLRRERDQAQLAVTDTGIGIAPAFLPHVFERFRQADSSITRRHGGLGLGLEIVRYLTKAHGGTVDAASPGEDGGATFTVTLPLQDAMTSQLRRTYSWTASAPRRSHLAGLNVLVVDDNEDAGELLALSFKRQGANVTSASSAADAIRELDRKTFEILLADVAMPGMDGFELIRTVRERERETGRTPVIAMAVTALCTPREQEQAISAGFDWHFGKPIDTDALVAHVAQLTNAPSPQSTERKLRA